MPDTSTPVVPSPSLNDWRPVPDPTTLTNEAVQKAVAALDELTRARIEGDRREVQTRLSGMDKAVDVLAAWRDRLPEVVRAEVAHLERLLTERFTTYDVRFEGIDKQFEERDKRTEQLTLASSKAIDAALQAQKESATETKKSGDLSIAKSENSTAESIRQLQTLFQTSNGSLADQIADLKGRLDRGEGKATVSDPAVAASLIELRAAMHSLATSRDTAQGHSLGSSQLWSIILGAIGAAAVVATLIDRVMR